jgi:hypothetical protein
MIFLSAVKSLFKFVEFYRDDHLNHCQAKVIALRAAYKFSNNHPDQK